MRHLIEKDNKNRKLVAHYEWKRVILKALLKCPRLSESGWIREWKKFPRGSSIVRIRNRCILSGRAGSVYRRFRLSRICLREEGNKGRLPGVERASW